MNLQRIPKLAPVLALFLAVPNFSAGASPEAAIKPTLDAAPAEAELMPEDEAIRERVHAYIERHGIDGHLNARQRLQRALYARKEWRRQQESKGIDDGTWINIGPINGAGRASCVAPHPSYEGVILEGAASGGVWKTLDGGTTWYPTTDDLSDLAVGALAWAPSSPDVAYLGSGEGDTMLAGGSGYIPGIGILRSDDGGESWYLPGQDSDPVAELFFALNVDPSNDEIVFAATEKGLQRSEDGGAHWQTLLSTGSGSYAYTEILRSSSNPDLMFAAQWCERSCPAGTDRVMRSTDRGLTWLPAGEETLPPLSGYMGRIALALSPSDDQILYLAAYKTKGSSSENPAAGIYRSDDGGDSWVETQLSSTNKPKGYLGYQGWYDNTITINPTNPDIVVAGGVWYVITKDGGETWINKNPYATPRNLPHVDVHDLQYQGQTLWVGCDGGAWISVDDGITWTDRNDGVVTRQYYGMAMDPMRPARVLGGTQDNGTNLRRDDDDDRFDTILGGDGFECAINPMMPDMMYGTIYNTAVYRITPPSSSFRNISPNYGDEDAPFITPLTINPDHPNIVFTGAESLYRSDNGGDSWYKLPVDAHDVSNGIWSGGEVWAIAVTPSDPDRIAVSKGSLVYNSRDGGRTWVMGMVGTTAFNIEISPFDPDLVIAAVRAGVRRSTDGGLTWSAGAEGLPPFNTQVIRFDPTDENIVYAGTDVGLYRSTDAGLSWQRWGSGLPAAPIDDLRIQPDGSMLRVASYGRGFWELDISRPANTTPVITLSSPSTSSLSLMLGDTVDVAATATDADGDDMNVEWYNSLNYETIVSDSGSGSINSAHTITIDHGGSYMISVRVTDSHGAQAMASFSVLVRDGADDCATPHVIPSDGPFPYSINTSNRFAGTQASDPQLPCVDLDTSSPDAGKQGSVWFEFTPAESGIYSIATCGSVADTMLSGWTGDACGDYTAIEGACNDDDEQAHCMGPRTDSYLELALDAGETYRFMAGSWMSPEGDVHRGLIHFSIDAVELENNSETTMIAAAAHADGTQGTSWLTDLQLWNPGTDSLVARFAFLPAEEDNSGVELIDLELDPGATANLNDVVGNFLGTQGSGAIRIEHDAPLMASSRTYNNAESGTFGQFIPGIQATQALAPGAAVRLIGLSGNSDFRTNIGFSNASAQTATINLKLYNADGALLWDTDREIPPWSWLQLSKVFQKIGAFGTTAGSALVSNLSAEAMIIPYASIVDSGTGDPTYVAPVSALQAGRPGWIEASSHANGAGDSVWRTDVELLNPGNETVTAVFSLMLRGQDNSAAEERSLEIPAGTSMKVGDVIDTLFGRTASAALRVSIDRDELFITSRTYNQAANGTYGQFIPAVPEDMAIRQGEENVLLSLRKSDNFRSNLGFVNITGEWIDINAVVFDAAGQEIITKNYSVAPYSYIQDSRAFPADTVLDGGFARVSTTTADGAFFAYASVVDNGSDDPVFIPAVPISR